MLHDTVTPIGLVINSGVYFDSTDWKQNSPHLHGLRFYMTHDPNDDVLPFLYAQKLDTILRNNGLVGRMEQNTRGHAELPDFLASSVLKLINAQ